MQTTVAVVLLLVGTAGVMAQITKPGGCSHDSGVFTCDYRYTVFVNVRVGVEFVCLFVGCLTSQQHASVSQGRICSGNFKCCHTEIEVADPTFYLT